MHVHIVLEAAGLHGEQTSRLLRISAVVRQNFQIHGTGEKQGAAPPTDLHQDPPFPPTSWLIPDWQCHVVLLSDAQMQMACNACQTKPSLHSEADDRHHGVTLSRRLMTDIIRGCRKASRTEVPRMVFMMGCSRAAIKPPLLLVSQPPRSSLSTMVTRHWWEGRPPSRYSGCRGDSVHPADITCHHCRAKLQAELAIM